MKQANLDQKIFSESKFRTIAHKNQKWITAGTQSTTKAKHSSSQPLIDIVPGRITLHIFSTQNHAVLPSMLQEQSHWSRTVQVSIGGQRLAVVANASTAEREERTAPSDIVDGDQLGMQSSLSTTFSKIRLRLRPWNWMRWRLRWSTFGMMDILNWLNRCLLVPYRRRWKLLKNGYSLQWEIYAYMWAVGLFEGGMPSSFNAYTEVPNVGKK